METKKTFTCDVSEQSCFFVPSKSSLDSENVSTSVSDPNRTSPCRNVETVKNVHTGLNSVRRPTELSQKMTPQNLLISPPKGKETQKDTRRAARITRPPRKEARKTAMQSSQTQTPMIQLHVENTNCTAGQVIKGHVSWTVPSKESESDHDEEARMIRSLELELLGYEQVITAIENPATNKISNSSQQLQPQHIQKEILVKFPYLLQDFSSPTSTKQEVGQTYEYLFEWELPSSLPSSFHCNCDNGTSIEISYQLIAKAIPTRGSVTLQDSVSLQVQAAKCVVPKGKPIEIAPQRKNLQTNVLFQRGAVHFGWKIPSDVLTTGSTIEITITGENRSQVDLKDFVVRLIETLIWQSPSTPMENKVEHVLSSSSIEVDRRREWLSENPGNVMAPPTIVALPIPDTIRCESYTSGTILRVEHSIVVIAQTATDRTTNPRLSYPVYVVRHSHTDGRVEANPSY